MSSERAPVEPSDMLARIIEAATGLFVARGYRGISMREIAAAAGISKAGLYYHFKDKEELFLAILTAHLAAVVEIIHDACRQEVTARQRVTHMLRGILTLPPEQRTIIRLANQEMVHVSQTGRSSFDELYHRKFIGQVEEILQAGIAQGELRPVNSQLATWLLLGMAYPLLSSNHPSDAMNEASELMVSVFFDGLTLR
jgi:AcrR family transcriptional regulator